MNQTSFKNWEKVSATECREYKNEDGTQGIGFTLTVSIEINGTLRVRQLKPYETEWNTRSTVITGVVDYSTGVTVDNQWNVKKVDFFQSNRFVDDYKGKYNPCPLESSLPDQCQDFPLVADMEIAQSFSYKMRDVIMKLIEKLN